MDLYSIATISGELKIAIGHFVKRNPLMYIFVYFFHSASFQKQPKVKAYEKKYSRIKARPPAWTAILLMAVLVMSWSTNWPTCISISVCR